MSQNVKRYDAGELRKPVETREGWLRVDGYIARTGLLEYLRSDGTTQVEYRPPEEAFHVDALASFDLVPVTNNHPPAGFLDDESTKLYQVGTVARARQDGERVAAHMLITDATAIAEVRSGKAQISGGYTCDLDFTPGEYQGRKYDAIQRNVRGNHVAIVKEGRAGPDIRLRLDTSDAEVVASHTPPDSTRIGQQTPKESTMANKTLKLDGLDVEVSEVAAQLIAKTEAAHAAALQALKDSAEKATARADAAEALAKKAEKELAEAPAKQKLIAEARVALETSARKVFGEGEKFDGKSDLEIKRAVAESVLEIKLDGKSEAHVDVSFEMAMKSHSDEAGTVERTQQGTKEISRTDGSNADPVEAARRKFYELTRNAR